jgi:hypothetical protein
MNAMIARYGGGAGYDTAHTDGMLVAINGVFASSQFLAQYNEQIFTCLSQRQGHLRSLTAPKSSEQPLRRCPFCSGAVKSSKHVLSEDQKYGSRAVLLDWCSRCAFWELFHEASYFSGEPSLEVTLCLSKLRSFTDALPVGCERELAQHIRRDPTIWNTLDPRRMETLVRDIFKANFAHSEAIHVGKSHDGGIDVIFVDADSLQWLVQVKRREHSDSVESVNTLRNLLGVLARENSRHGIVVSTCDHFSYRVYEEAGQAMEHGFHVRLIDKGVLDRMIGAFLPSNPWLPAFERLDVELLEAARADFLR